MSGRDLNPRGCGGPPPEILTGELLGQYAGLVSFFRFRLPGSRREEAEDFAQATLTAAWVRLRTTSGGDIEHLPAFVLGIARHKLSDAYSGAATSRQESYDPNVLDGFPGRLERLGIEHRLEIEQLRARLRRALRKIRHPDRELLWLRYHDGLPHADACRRLKLSPEEGSRLIYRARQKLRFLLRADAPRRAPRAVVPTVDRQLR